MTVKQRVKGKMTVDEKEKDDATWASDRLYDTYSRHCKNMGEEPELSYEEFKENISLRE